MVGKVKNETVKRILTSDLAKTGVDYAIGLNRKKYQYFFPKKAYRCTCLGVVITSCFQRGIYTFTDIVDEITKSRCCETTKIFCVKCGRDDENVVFTCADHMSVLVVVAIPYKCTELPNETNITVFNGQTYCCGCIRKCLREMYHYYHFNVMGTDILLWLL